MQANNIITQVLERMLPVGSIVEWSPVDGGNADLSSAEKVAAYYGFGTWEAYGSGQMLLGVSDSHAVGSTGGEETHSLTLEELPERVNIDYAQDHTPGYNPAIFGLWASAIPTNAYSIGIGGKNEPFSILPPYITIYRWRRIA